MNTYNTLQELVKATRCTFAQKTEFGWVARRSAKNATHKLHYTFVHGQLDRNQVVSAVYADTDEARYQLRGTMFPSRGEISPEANPATGNVNPINP